MKLFVLLAALLSIDHPVGMSESRSVLFCN